MRVERGGAGVVSTPSPQLLTRRNTGIEGELAEDASRAFQIGGELSLSLSLSLSSSLLSFLPCIVRRYMFFLFDELLMLILR